MHDDIMAGGNVTSAGSCALTAWALLTGKNINASWKDTPYMHSKVSIRCPCQRMRTKGRAQARWREYRWANKWVRAITFALSNGEIVAFV